MTCKTEIPDSVMSCVTVLGSSNLVTTEPLISTVTSSLGTSHANSTLSPSTAFDTIPVKQTLAAVRNSQCLYPLDMCIALYLNFLCLFSTENMSTSLFPCSPGSRQGERYRLFCFTLFCPSKKMIGLDIPKWVLVMIVVGVLCGVLGTVVCSVCIVKWYRRNRSQTTLSDEESGNYSFFHCQLTDYLINCPYNDVASIGDRGTLPHQKRERRYVEGPRIMSGSSYDTIRLYETICGENEGAPCSTKQADSAVSDSGGYMQMKALAHRKDVKNVPGHSDGLSGSDTADYMEMKRQELSADTAVMEQTDKGDTE